MSMSIQEAGDPCLGKEECKDCSLYMDTCDGKEEISKSHAESLTLGE